MFRYEHPGIEVEKPSGRFCDSGAEINVHVCLIRSYEIMQCMSSDVNDQSQQSGRMLVSHNSRSYC